MIILFAILIFLTLLACLIIKLRKQGISKRQNRLVCLIIPLFIVAFFVCVFVGSYTRRVHDVHIIEHLLSSVKFSIDGNRVFTAENERLGYVDSLNRRIDEVKKIAEYDELVSFFIGGNQELSIRISELQKILEEQHHRCKRLNVILSSDVIFEDEQYRPLLFSVYTQNVKTLSVKNIAFKLKYDVDSIQTVGIQVCRAERVLFSQSYNYNKNLNCFVLPNISSDSLYIKMGVITKKNGKKVWIYTKR